MWFYFMNFLQEKRKIRAVKFAIIHEKVSDGKLKLKEREQVFFLSSALILDMCSEGTMLESKDPIFL